MTRTEHPIPRAVMGKTELRCRDGNFVEHLVGTFQGCGVEECFVLESVRSEDQRLLSEIPDPIAVTSDDSPPQFAYATTPADRLRG